MPAPDMAAPDANAAIATPTLSLEPFVPSSSAPGFLPQGWSGTLMSARIGKMPGKGAGAQGRALIEER